MKSEQAVLPNPCLEEEEEEECKMSFPDKHQILKACMLGGGDARSKVNVYKGLISLL
jgi:hypothetical protein